MTLQEIKTAIENGNRVFWRSKAYEVIKYAAPLQWLIVCAMNADCIGLTWLDGVTMNGHESDFFTA